MTTETVKKMCFILAAEFAAIDASKEPFSHWTLQSGFDGDELLMRAGIEVTTLAAEVIQRAEVDHCVRALPS